MDIKKKVLSGLGWTASGRIAAQIISWASTIFVIRLLEPRDYGLMAMAMVIVLLSELVSQSGAGEALVRSKRATKIFTRQIYGLVILVNGTIFVVVVLISVPVAAFFEEPNLTRMIPVLALRFLISTFSVVPLARLRRQLRFRLVATVDVVARLGSSLVVLVLAFSGLGVWALVMGRLTQSLLQALTVNLLARFRGTPLFDFSGMGDAIRFSGLTSLQRILWFIYTESDKVIIGKLASTQALGVYNVAMQLAALPLDKLGAVLGSVAYPAFARVGSTPERVGRYLLYAVRLLAILGFPVFFGISALAPLAVPLILGDRWLDVVRPLQILCTIMPLRLVAVGLAPALNAIGRPDAVARVYGLAAVLFPTGYLVGIRFGVVGVALAWAVVMPIWFCIMAATAGRHTQSSLGGILRRMGSPFVAATVMWVAVTLSGRVLEGLGISVLASVLSLVVMGVLVYASVIVLVDRQVLEDLKSLRQRSP